ncbi:ClpP/crotonase-like domain-containing protein [Ilyonectria destructans]|nr:ClpP/crotonase-like domain-containing protein [Ilyonectria destructans]
MAHSPQLQWTLETHHDEIDIYRSGTNRKIVLRRPKNGNALTTAMVAQLTNYYRQSVKDKSIYRIIITAEGRFFCTGMDLGKSSTAVNQGDDASSREYRKFVDLFQAIQEAPQVTIACINGPCYAGGIGLAFSCDIRLAVGSATATLSEVKLGLCPAIISKYLVREWGPAFTREAMLSGRAISMAELKAIGAVHGLAEDIPGLDLLMASYVSKLRGCAPGASAMCKEAVHVGYTYAGQEEQDQVIGRIFKDMMALDSESKIGVCNFQAGRKKMDWDGLIEQSTASKL